MPKSVKKLLDAKCTKTRHEMQHPVHAPMPRGIVNHNNQAREQSVERELDMCLSAMLENGGKNRASSGYVVA